MPYSFFKYNYIKILSTFVDISVVFQYFLLKFSQQLRKNSSFRLPLKNGLFHVRIVVIQHFSLIFRPIYHVFDVLFLVVRSGILHWKLIVLSFLYFSKIIECNLGGFWHVTQLNLKISINLKGRSWRSLFKIARLFLVILGIWKIRSCGYFWRNFTEFEWAFIHDFLLIF